MPFSNLARLDTGATPLLIVVVDTEEEFDWAAPHSRSNTGVAAMSKISIGQSLFESYGVRPCYVVDFPVVTQQAAIEPLCEFRRSKKAVIGAHLHPWVNPPHVEEVNARNSFPGNLPFDVERRKLAELTNQLTAALQEPITIYKAGRYGIGPNTPRILAELGYQVDLSPAPPFDYSSDGGPDFGQHSNDLSWLDRAGGVLSIPCTGAFIGHMAAVGHRAYPFLNRSIFRQARAPGILARLRMLERIRLSPEGFTLDDMVRLTNELLRCGVRVLTLSFHSPSLSPGHTPYVRSQRDLRSFLDLIRAYLDFFRDEAGGRVTTPDEVREMLITESRLESGTATRISQHQHGD